MFDITTHYDRTNCPDREAAYDLMVQLLEAHLRGDYESMSEGFNQVDFARFNIYQIVGSVRTMFADRHLMFSESQWIELINKAQVALSTKGFAPGESSQMLKGLIEKDQFYNPDL